jgi:hypothetical protein
MTEASNEPTREVARINWMQRVEEGRASGVFKNPPPRITQVDPGQLGMRPTVKVTGQGSGSAGGTNQSTQGNASDAGAASGS